MRGDVPRQQVNATQVSARLGAGAEDTATAVSPRQSAALAYHGLRAPPVRIRAGAPDQAMYQVGIIHDGQCRCVIRFDARLDEQRLRQAVQLSLRAAPVFACRYVPHRWRASWESDDIDAPAPYGATETSTPAAAVHGFLAAPMRPLLGPPIAVRLVRSTYDTLCLKLHHLAADAGGLLNYVRLLRGLYTRLATNPGYVPAASSSARGYGQVLRQAHARDVLRGLVRLQVPKPEWGLPAIGSDRSGRAFAARTLGAARVERLRAWARAHEATVGDVLLVAMHRGCTAVLQPSPGALLPIEVSFDLRRYLPPDQRSNAWNLSAAHFPAIRYRPNYTFAETLQAFRGALAETRHNWLGGALLVEVMAKLPTFAQTGIARRLLNRSFASAASPTLASLGVLDPALFDFGDAGSTDVDLLGPVLFPPHFLANVYTLGDRLIVNTSFCDTAVDPALIAALLDSFIAELPG